MRPDRSKLVVIDDLALDEQDKFKWTWKEGGAITLADVGDPRDLDGQHVCVFDAAEQVVARFDLPPGGTCGTKPCWQQTSSRIAYNDPTVSSDGVRKMTLRLGAAGIPKIAFKAQGLDTPDLPMPVSLPLTIELQRPTGQCWSATYTSETVPVNSLKPMIGHTLGAAGVLELTGSILGMRGGFVPPTLNYQEPDPSCNLNVVGGQAREQRIGVLLSTKSAFGGANVAIVARRV